MPSIHELVTGDGLRGVTAVLGPTNTGKTHLAIERMLRHRSGMIGLPLRLLAREVYEKVVDRVGESQVALVTGEEKRIPQRARYFICTVEAMLQDRVFPFIAVDEIQLMTHRTRGHVFTDRVLRARGTVETMFLGSPTARAVFAEMVPQAEVISQPRLSRLRHAGHHTLKRLPPRSAIVAFSAAQVYEIAERLRRKYGGAAVVLGALSPRTRNAQVAMYESGEVPVLVATDAIGMGLNLDINHVAFADTRKFDGRTRRDLHDDELAQIAGRAGRFLKDGTFGTTGDADALEFETIEAIEQHHFPPIKRVWWRNPEPNFSSLDGLLESLEEPPMRRRLKRMPDADDHAALTGLSHIDEVRERAVGEERVRLLWSVAGIPDYRKRLTGDHARLLGQVFVQLCDGGRLAPDWIDERLDRLERIEGEIGALMTRIAHVRTWTFIAHKEEWVGDPLALQARARRLEDRLSDALHERLTARFVDDRMGIVVPSGSMQIAINNGEVRLGENYLGRLRGLMLDPPLSDNDMGRRAAKALTRPLQALAMELVGAPDEALTLSPDGRILWRKEPIATMRRGKTPLEPKIVVMASEALGSAHEAAVALRLSRWLMARTAVWRLKRMGKTSRRVGQVLDGLEAGLGMTRLDGIAKLRTEERANLRRAGVQTIGRWAFASEVFTSGDPALHGALVAAWTQSAPRPIPRTPTTTSRTFDANAAMFAGYIAVGREYIHVTKLHDLGRLLQRFRGASVSTIPTEKIQETGLKTIVLKGAAGLLGDTLVQVAGEWKWVPSPEGRSKSSRKKPTR